MSDIHELPNNDVNYYRKAQNLIEQQRYIEATELLEKSYAIEPNVEVFEELVKLYLTFQLIEPLRNLWDKAYPHNEQIYLNEKISFLYGLSLPLIMEADQALIELYRLKDHSKELGRPIEHLIKGITLLNDQQLFERTVLKATSEDAVEQLIQNLISKGSLDFLTKVKLLYRMPLAQTEVLLRAILVHDAVENYIKSDVLHYFIMENIPGEFDLNWFGETTSVSAEQLKPYKESTTYLDNIGSIQDYCEQHNPHLYDDIMNQFTLHAMVFYPFLDKVLPHPKAWLDYFLLQNGLEDDEIEIDQNLIRYYDLANQELEGLMHR